MKELKCLVCGMKINEKNYNKNECSYVHKNEKNLIFSCPFCGVDHKCLESDLSYERYMVEEKDLDEKSLKTLDKAMKLEIFNAEFYEEAYHLAQKENIKQLFKDLKNIEIMHAQIHKRLGRFDVLPKLHRPDYTKHNTDQLLLQETQKREKHASKFYIKNSKMVSSSVLKKVFKSLSEVETQHKWIAENNLGV